jgi:hypothetical protein
MYQRFIDLWGTTSPFTFDNEKFTPPTKTAWVRVTVRHDDSTLELIGGTQAGGFNKYQRTGRLTVQVFTPLNEGVEEADTLAQTARDIFEGVTLSSNAIRFNDVIVREIGPDEGWYQFNVEAVFQYDERK